MGFVYDLDSAALVLRQAKPVTIKGAWNVIKESLIKSGEIVVNSGVVQKVMSITKTASTTETAGETLSALCAMDVTESTVAGATVTTLTPKAAIAFTPKTVALIAGALGLDFGFRIGQNLVNLYFGEEWDWHAPGIFDVAKDAIRTYITADGKTYYDEETVNAIANRLNDIGAFADDDFEPASLIFQESSDNPKYSNFNLTSAIKLPNANSMDIKEQNLYVMLRRLISDHNVVISSNTLTVIYGFSLNAIDSPNNLILEQYILPENCKTYLYGSGKLLNKDIKDFNGYYQTDLDFGSASCALVFDKPIKRKLRVDMGCKIYNREITYVNYVGDDSVVDLVYPNAPFTLSSSQSTGKYFAFNMGDITSGGIEGVDKQDGATVPSNFPLDIPQTYPTWQANPIVKPDESAITYPVEMPDEETIDGTATKPQEQAQTGVNTDAENSKVIEDAITIVPEIAQEIEATADPTIDGGVTPTPIIPSIGTQGTGFVALYNPTQSQLSAFSQYMWSNDFIENFKKLFSNPMDAIIGLHLIYATPSRGNVAEIVCGYSHSGVMSNTVNSQYIEIDCGSIKVNRYFGNVLDYAPYTKLQVYLPFVGIVDLDTNEIMDGTLNIKYRIDVLTGSCLARLKITRGDYNAELYNFAGNCAVQLPISGGSYSGIIANAIGVAGSIGATISTGGAMAPVLVGSVVSSAVNSHTNVSHSGSLGSNAGALGIMKPYLIITRPKPAEANKFNEFYGKPSNKTVRLSSCSGYTRVKEVHVDNIVATDNELSEIEQLLKEGVII